MTLFLPVVLGAGIPGVSQWLNGGLVCSHYFVKSFQDYLPTRERERVRERERDISSFHGRIQCCNS